MIAAAADSAPRVAAQGARERDQRENRHFPRHRAIARWTLPIWLYVSVTGVVIYWMLYRL